MKILQDHFDGPAGGKGRITMAKQKLEKLFYWHEFTFTVRSTSQRWMAHSRLWRHTKSLGTFSNVYTGDKSKAVNGVDISDLSSWYIKSHSPIACVSLIFLLVWFMTRLMGEMMETRFVMRLWMTSIWESVQFKSHSPFACVSDITCKMFEDFMNSFSFLNNTTYYWWYA